METDIIERDMNAETKAEQILVESLQQSIQSPEGQSSPVEEEFSTQLPERDANFINYVLENAPVILGHQDKELRYLFMYNHYPSLREEEYVGKTDVEIFTGSGVKESLDFKREVLEKGLPAKREITFETEMFGTKTFLMYLEPVFSKTGDTNGINYVGMDVTDQVRKREKMEKLHEEKQATLIEWIFLLTGLCLEIFSIAFDQAASLSKPQYALFGMILAIAAVLICILELIYKGKKEKVELQRLGVFWWFYHPPPNHRRLFGTLPDFYGLIGSISQCICSTVQYVWFSRHADNPIKMSLWPAIFLICLGAKRLTEKLNETHGHKD